MRGIWLETDRKARIIQDILRGCDEGKIMARKKGSSLLELRKKNRIYIKDTIFYMEPITRTAIAQELGLTLPTITTSVNEMIEEGLLQEIPLPEEALSQGAGRKPQGIGFIEQAVQAIGVEMGPYATRAVLMDLRGHILECAEAAPGALCYDEMLEALCGLIRSLVEKADVDRLLGIGIGLPGFIERDRGILRSSRNGDWQGRHLASDVAARTGQTVFIDNNVRLRAIGYEMELRGKRPESFAYFFISRGIACPLMAREHMLSGYTPGAGEIGHTILCVPEETGERECSLESLAGEAAILQACRTLITSGHAAQLRALAAESGNLGIREVVRAQEAGDIEVEALVRRRLGYLGIAMANVVNLVSPDFVVTDGELLQRRENWEFLKQMAKAHFWGINEEEVQVLLRPFDYLHGAKGAAYFVIRRRFLEKE